MPFLAEGYAEVRQANNVGLALSFLMVLASILAMALVMQLLLEAGGANVRLSKVTALTFIANSWSVTFPGGAAVSTVYQYRAMRHWGVSVLVSSWFIVVSGVLSTLWLIGLGLVSVLFLDASFSIWPLLATAAMLIGLGFLVFSATNHPSTTARLVCSVVQAFNRVLRRDPRRGVDTVRGHILQLHAVHLRWQRFSVVAAMSLLNWLLEIGSLWLCVWAVTEELPGFERMGETPSILGVVLAFVTAKIVGTAQITPAGLGPVEAAMTASLVAVGLPVSSAFGTVFVYRILAFVVIAALGWVIYAVSVMRGGMKANEPDDAEAAPRRRVQ